MRLAGSSDAAARDRLARPLQERQEWDAIAAGMSALLEDPAAARVAGDEEELA